MTWTPRKRFLGCLIDTLSPTISLPNSRLKTLQTALVEILPTQHRTLCRKWVRLFGIMRSIAPALPGGGGVSLHIQVVFSDSQGRLHLSTAVHNNLQYRGRLMKDLASRPTHLRENPPPPPRLSTEHTTPDGTYLEGYSRAQTTFHTFGAPGHHLTSNAASYHGKTPASNATWAKLKIFTGVTHMALLAPDMTPLDHTYNRCDITNPTGRTNRQSTTHSVLAGALLRQHALILRDYTVTASVAYLPGDNNIISDAASCRWDLTNTHLLAFFNLQFPQQHSL